MLRTYNCGIGMVIILDKNIFNDIDNEELLNMINNNNLIPIGLITKNTKNSTSFINYEKIKNKFN